jgi:hypothetical protein
VCPISEAASNEQQINVIQYLLWGAGSWGSIGCI